MTYKECLQEAINAFKASGIDEDDSSFDAYQLFLESFKMSANELSISGLESPSNPELLKFQSAIKRRTSGEPLQYIIGEWDFYDSTFKVGPGVLIPRPETEILVDEAIKFLEKSPFFATVYDLCAGTGCVGISIAKKYPSVNVICIEKSYEAYRYLETNIVRNHAENVTAVLGNVLDGFKTFDYLGKPDCIVSNPPYIRSNEIPDLQREVLNEPRMALDGGEDGLIFYRSLAKDWLPFLNEGGILLCECGEDEAGEIEKIYSTYSGQTSKIQDYAGIYRVVTAKKC